MPEIPVDTADVLERAADLLFIYGRCKTVGEDSHGRLCVLGAIREASGAKLMYQGPHVRRFGAHLMTAVEINDPYNVVRGLPERAPWVWNDSTDDDALVIDTLRLCAKDLRNEAQA